MNESLLRGRQSNWPINEDLGLEDAWRLARLTDKAVLGEWIEALRRRIFGGRGDRVLKVVADS